MTSADRPDAEPAAPLLAVIFDLDGLMFNTEELYIDVGSALLRRRGREFCPDLMNAMMGRPGLVAYRTMIAWHGLDDSPQALAEEAGELFGKILDDGLRPMPGLVELLAAIEAAGLPKAIATSSQRRYVDRVLAPLSLAPRFDAIWTIDDVLEGKPHPEIYLKAAQSLGVRPAEALVLEDSQTGCTAAAAAGTFLVAVPGEHSKSHCFDMAQLVADSLADPRIYRALRLATPR